MGVDESSAAVGRDGEGAECPACGRGGVGGSIVVGRRGFGGQIEVGAPPIGIYESETRDPPAIHFTRHRVNAAGPGGTNAAERTRSGETEIVQPNVFLDIVSVRSGLSENVR
jgi:hypothetical protein